MVLNVAYDEVIDLFAYQAINLTSSAVNNVAASGSLTGILRGDVTSSYNAAADASTSIKYFTEDINTLYDKGVFNPTETVQTGGSGPYAAVATVNGAETMSLGSNTGVHVITDMEDVDTRTVRSCQCTVYHRVITVILVHRERMHQTLTAPVAAIITALFTALQADAGTLAVDGKWTDSVVTGDNTTAVAFDIDDTGN